MKPITEQRRQELIADCQKEIGNLMLWLECGPLRDRSKTESELLRQQIALASLTAAPEVSEIESVHPENGNTIIHLRRGGLKNISQDDIAEYEMIETEKFYPAPPVPVIKFPDWSQASPDGFLDINADLARYYYGEEIKRLNGLESS